MYKYICIYIQTYVYIYMYVYTLRYVFRPSGDAALKDDAVNRKTIR